MNTATDHPPTPPGATVTTSRGASPVLVFGSLALAAVVFAMLQSLIGPALLIIGADLHASTANLSWLVTAYLLAAAIATPVASRLGDMFGRRRVLLAVLGMLAAGAAVAALAGNLPVLVIGRVLQGAGGAILPLSFGVVRDVVSRERVGVMVGLLSALLGVGAGLGSVLAGPVVADLNWHWLFWIPLIAIVVAGVGVFLAVPGSPPRAAARIDLPGTLLLSAVLVCLLLALSKGSGWGWTSALTLGLFAAAAACLGGWIVVELRTQAPLVDMRMLARRGVWTTNIAALAFGVATFGSSLLVPLLLQAPASTGYGLGKSVSESGLFLLPSVVAMIVFAPLSGVLYRHFGAKLPLVIGICMTTAAYVLLAVAHRAAWHVLIAVSLLGIGLGLASSAMTNAVLETVPPSQSSVATSMNTLGRTIGGSLGTAVIAAVLSATTTAERVSSEAGFTASFWICASAPAIALIAALLLPGRGSAGNAVSR